jgi:hypothetical protein
MFKGFRRELKSVLSLDVYDYDLLSAKDFIGSCKSRKAASALPTASLIPCGRE